MNAVNYPIEKAIWNGHGVLQCPMSTPTVAYNTSHGDPCDAFDEDAQCSGYVIPQPRRFRSTRP